MDEYKDYSCLKNYYSAVSSTVTSTDWNNGHSYGTDDCSSSVPKWSNSESEHIATTNNYGNSNNGQSSCYYHSENVQDQTIKTEYSETMFSTMPGHVTESNTQFIHSKYQTDQYMELPSSQNHVVQSCPPDSTFSPNQSLDSSSNNKKSNTNRSIRCKNDRIHETDSSTGPPTTIRKATLRPHSTPATLMWLEGNYELADGVCIPRSVLYLHYVDFCNLNRVQPVNAASFGKIIRQQFPHLTTRRLGTRGQSRYHYYGIGIKDNSPYYQLSSSSDGIGDNKSAKNNSINNGFARNQHQTSSESKMARNGSISKLRMPKTLDNSTPTSTTVSSTNIQTGMFHQGSNESYNEKIVRSEHMTQCHSKLYYNLSVRNGRGIDSNGSLRSVSASSSHVGSLMPSFVPSLPPFPTAEELELCQGSHNNLVSTFLLMYRAHCQRILDAIVRANFDEVHTLIYHFWQQIPHHLIPILDSNLLINLLAICDIRLYRTIVKLISVTLAQPLSDIAYSQLNDFVNSLDSVLNAALHKENQLLIQIKLELAKHFASIIQYCNDFKLFIANITDLSQLFEWFENMWQTMLQWYRTNWFHHQRNHSHSHLHQPTIDRLDLEFAKQFLVLWSFARIRINEELSRMKAISEDLFGSLATLFDDFCLYKVKDLYFDHCATVLFENASTNQKPCLPQHFEPKDLIKQSASLLHGWEWLAPNDIDTWNRSETMSSEYREMTTSTTTTYGHHHHHHSWMNYGGTQQTNVNYPEPLATGQPNQYGANIPEYDAPETQHRAAAVAAAAAAAAASGATATTRPNDGLICFSMNFHANSIQVMTTPSSSTNSHNVEPEIVDHCSHYTPHANNQAIQSSSTSSSSSSSSAAVSATSYRSIKCHLNANDDVNNGDCIESTNNLYHL
ncbi:hypothetical protein RDWZM_004665 [Blomia tropicalis]|uniref:DNA-binding protein RFX6 n=1 Tax=Blomia tropicalis TaxID=40697 RepID=A0A9Q0M2H4_BLOTA|nr:hypothetical protein RDWZM_004665 [Blomia tropicalis]